MGGRFFLCNAMAMRSLAEEQNGQTNQADHSDNDSDEKLPVRS